ncbi:Transposon Ty3-I Gag-Pol [Labeo rohita]|uniref:Transposon Ty3-I Gag-Pol n=1 Tax=Labeo rohita TaxID=84645 RepID=A0A498LUP2_LABRO|nr:Transposon Ty3-I Gag-Pol [Labeo rohita]
MIAAYVGQQHQTWDQWLPEFRYPINTTQQESTGKTPAELMLGRQVLEPLERLIHRPPSPDQAAYSLVERQNIMAEEVKSNPPKTDVINVVNLKRYYGRLPLTP